MKHLSSPKKIRPYAGWSGLAAAALLAFALAGCGGGDDGAPGATGATGPTGPQGPAAPPAGSVVAIPSNTVAATPDATAAWAALQPQVSVTSVSIASPPVVKFTVKDAAGKPVVGLGNTSQSSSQTLPVLTNFYFTLAKLVPGSTYAMGGATKNAEPSKWVTYMVTKPPSVAQKAGTLSATDSCDSTTAPTVCGTYPTYDREGTLVDNGDGSYQYTFYRDPKQAAALVASLKDSTDGLSKKADLGDVTYDATLTHRLGIQLSGAAPGTGSNNPKGSSTGAPATVSIGNPANVWYDFVPAGGTPTATREIVKIDSCSSCHDGKVLAHGSRKDPNYCVTCHTDQIKYSFNAGDAPMTFSASTVDGFTFAVQTGTNAAVRPKQAIVGGRAVGNYPNMIHKVHMGKELVKQGYNFNNDEGPMLFNEVEYPQSVLNCTKCHTGTASTDPSTAKATANGDNWMNNPSLLACGSCHDGINFATGKGSTLADKAADLKAKVAIGTTQSNHEGGAWSDNSACSLCHTSAAIATVHNDKLPSTASAALRTMSAAISKVDVGAADGSVTVTFSMKDKGVAVTDPAAFNGVAFSLAKLLPAKDGASTNWMSYTARARTKDALQPPVLQGYSELAAGQTATASRPAMTAGTLTHIGSGVWTYKFALLNAATPGDIRTIDHVLNVSSVAGAYNFATVPTYPNVVAYEPSLTHRVGMEFSTAAGVNNTTNAFFDFVPDGVTKAQTRNIVSMTTCASCHAGRKIHKGYATEYCVTCHNKNTYEPYSGASPVTVDLQHVVHKIHSKGTDYVINGEAYGRGPGEGYPGVIKNCVKCHDENATKADGKTKLENAANWYTTPTKEACATCHDGAPAVAHMDLQILGVVQTCVTCHGVGRDWAVKDVHK